MSSLAQKAAAFTLKAKAAAELIATRRIAARREARPVQTSVGGFSMESCLEDAARRQDDRRFTGAPLTDFGTFS